LGSGAFAATAFARAQMTYATALMAFGRYNLTLNGLRVASFASPSPDALIPVEGSKSSTGVEGSFLYQFFLYCHW
jgi:hypothetical protein